jgi:outer membrane lipoprotein-sorting protein
MKSKILKVLLVAVMVLSAPSLCWADAGFAKIVSDAKARYENYTKSFQDMTTQMQTQISTPNGPMTQDLALFAKGAKFRAETTMNIPGLPAGMEGMNGMKTTVISDGTDAWVISPMTGRMRVPRADTGQYRQDSAYWDQLSDRAKLVGSETIQGRDCYVIETEAEGNNPPVRMWLDKKDLVMMKTESVTQQGRFEMVFSDFRDVKGGWKMPFKIDSAMNGVPFSTTSIQSIDFNRGLPDEMFDPARG